MNASARSLGAVALCALFACSGDPKPQPDLPGAPATAEGPTPAPPEAPTATAAVPDAPPAAPVELAEGADAAPPEKAPTIAIKSPTANQVIPADKAGDFEVKLDLKGWEVPAGGNHVHLILDGRPYKRLDDAKGPIKLKDLDPSYTLAEGQHVLVAFPSRPTHESVKPIGKAVPLAVVTFWVGKKGEAKWKPTDPTLIFSRPKGANDGTPPAEGILIDYYLANVELGDGKFSIETTVTGPGLESGKKVAIKSWKPWRLKNPRDGKYTIRMALLDKDGKPVPGAMNDVTREFTVNTKATASSDHDHAPHATGVIECDHYLARMHHCAQSAPPDARRQIHVALAQTQEAWVAANASPGAAAALREACTQAVGALAQNPLCR